MLEALLDSLTSQLASRTATLTSATCHLEQALSQELDRCDDRAMLYRALPLLVSRLLGVDLVAAQPGLPAAAYFIPQAISAWLDFATSATDCDALLKIFLPDGILATALLSSHYMLSQQQRISVAASAMSASSTQHTYEVRAAPSKPARKVDGIQYLFACVIAMALQAPVFRKRASHLELCISFYSTLLSAYLNFLLPIPSTLLQNEPPSSVLTSRAIAGARGVTPTSLAIASALTTFFVDCLAEHWLSGAFPSPSDLRPFWRALYIFTSHLLHAFVECNPARLSVPTLQLPPMLALTVDASIVLAEKSFVDVRILWFRFMHAIMSNAVDVAISLDAGNLREVSEVLDAWIAPWSAHPPGATRSASSSTIMIPLDEQSDAFVRFWTPFIQNNAVFYEVLGGLLLRRLFDDLYRHSVVAVSSKGNLEAEELVKLDACLTVLVDVLGPLLPISSILRSLEQQSDEAIKEQMQVLQVDCLQSIFGAQFRKYVLRAVVCLIRLDEAIKKQTAAVTASYAQSPWKRMSSWFATARQGPSMDPATGRRLLSLIGQTRHDLTTMFSIAQLEYERFIREGCSVDEAALGDASYASRQKATRRKRLPSPEQAKIPPAPVKSDLPKSYEVAALIPITDQLSAYLTEQFRAIVRYSREQYPALVPETLEHTTIHMRWLAAKPNLIFLSIVMLAWYVLV